MRTEHGHASDHDSHHGDHWVYLDRTWAQRLGVKRSAGIYRVRGRDLLNRLSREDGQADRPGARLR
jgi:hypothetical protein